MLFNDLYFAWNLVVILVMYNQYYFCVVILTTHILHIVLTTGFMWVYYQYLIIYAGLLLSSTLYFNRSNYKLYYFMWDIGIIDLIF